MTADHSIGKGIIEQIIDGSITIDTIDEFESILKIFPESPEIRRLYADLLVGFRKIDTAVASYHRASEQFLEKSAIPQAIVASLLAWQQRKPSADQLKRFYHRMLESNRRVSPLCAFLADLSMSELLSLIVRMERIRLPPNRTFIWPGCRENSLYFIVHGSVTGKGCHDPSGVAGDPTVVRQYLEKDVIGDILPLDAPTYARKTLETLEQTELVRISKASLAAISNRFPSFAEKLSTLLRRQRVQNGRGNLNRRTCRRNIPVRIKLESPAPPDTIPSVIRGMVKDMSIDGISVVLDKDSASAAPPRLRGTVVNLHMNLPNESMTLTVRGRIVWDRKADCQTSSTVALGIQFLGLPPSLSGLLLVFADYFVRL